MIKQYKAAQELEGLDPPMEDAPYPAGLSPQELRRVRMLWEQQPSKAPVRQPSLSRSLSSCTHQDTARNSGQLSMQSSFFSDAMLVRAYFHWLQRCLCWRYR